MCFSTCPARPKQTCLPGGKLPMQYPLNVYTPGSLNVAQDVMSEPKFLCMQQGLSHSPVTFFHPSLAHANLRECATL